MESAAGSEADQRIAQRRSRIEVRVIGLKDDHDAFDREYFAALSLGQKMTMVGKMFAEQWLLAGGNADQLRLRGDSAHLERRGG